MARDPVFGKGERDALGRRRDAKIGQIGVAQQVAAVAVVVLVGDGLADLMGQGRAPQQLAVRGVRASRNLWP